MITENEIIEILKGYFKKSPYYDYQIMCGYDIEHAAKAILKKLKEKERPKKIKYLNDNMEEDRLMKIFDRHFDWMDYDFKEHLVDEILDKDNTTEK